MKSQLILSPGKKKSFQWE